MMYVCAHVCVVWQARPLFFLVRVLKCLPSVMLLFIIMYFYFDQLYLHISKLKYIIHVYI